MSSPVRDFLLETHQCVDGDQSGLFYVDPSPYIERFTFSPTKFHRSPLHTTESGKPGGIVLWYLVNRICCL